MRIECPSCHAAYDVPPDRLGAGRPVRCARCATTWTPTEPAVEPPPVMSPASAELLPVPPEPAEQAAAEPSVVAVAPIQPSLPPGPEGPAEPAIAAPVPEPAVSRPGRAAPLAAWLLSISLLAGLGWAAIHYRTSVAEAWPPSVRLYTLLGLR